MNKDQIKGAARAAVGKLEKKVGKATSNGTLAVKGAVREVAGKAQKAYGDVKENAKDAPRRDRDIERHAR